MNRNLMELAALLLLLSPPLWLPLLLLPLLLLRLRLRLVAKERHRRGSLPRFA